MKFRIKISIFKILGGKKIKKMEIQESFNVAMEKMMNLDINTVFWSNIMDLIAILTKSNILEVVLFS